MASDRYPNFRRAQREGGPFSRRTPYAQRDKIAPFGPFVIVASAAVFMAVLFGDRVPTSVVEARQAYRNIGRDHAPPAGAFYPGCNAARAAGVAPLYAGEPGYRPDMDGDGDGIACEPYRGAWPAFGR